MVCTYSRCTPEPRTMRVRAVFPRSTLSNGLGITLCTSVMRKPNLPQQALAGLRTRMLCQVRSSCSLGTMHTSGSMRCEFCSSCAFHADSFGDILSNMRIRP